MKNSKKLLGLSTIMIVLFSPCQVFATPQYTGWVRINSIQDYGFFDEGMVVLTTGTPVNPAGCTLPQYYSFRNTAANYKTRSAMLMAAFLGGKEVNFLVSDTDCDFGSSYPRVWSISIREP